MFLLQCCLAASLLSFQLFALTQLVTCNSSMFKSTRNCNPLPVTSVITLNIAVTVSTQLATFDVVDKVVTPVQNGTYSASEQRLISEEEELERMMKELQETFPTTEGS